MSIVEQNRCAVAIRGVLPGCAGVSGELSFHMMTRTLFDTPIVTYGECPCQRSVFQGIGLRVGVLDVKIFIDNALKGI